jgi:hypothetical protein
LTGSAEFKKLAEIKAIRRGFDLQDAKLKQYAVTYLKKETDRQASQHGFTKALFTHGPEAVNSSISFTQLIKMATQNIKMNSDELKKIDQEIAELTRELAAIPETEEEIWFMEVPQLKAAFNQRSLALAKLKPAESAVEQTRAHRVLGVFRTRPEKIANAELAIARTHYTDLDRAFNKLNKSVRTPDMRKKTDAIVARRQAIEGMLDSLKNKNSTHISLRSDWQLLEGDLRKYSEILSDKQFAVKTSILTMHDDILQAATEKLRKPRTQHDAVLEDKNKLELTLNDAVTSSELLNTKTQSLTDNEDDHNQEVVDIDIPAP